MHHINTMPELYVHVYKIASKIDCQISVYVKNCSASGGRGTIEPRNRSAAPYSTISVLI